MESSAPSIEFTLTSLGTLAVHVRMRRRGDRWLAEVTESEFAAALGSSAREALAVALQPFGDSAMRMLLADLGLLAPSVAVLEMEAEARLA
ncbi:MAG: hypothetical protein WD830_02340 [Chloroflexota bacterium]